MTLQSKDSNEYFGMGQDGYVLLKEDSVHYEVESVDMKNLSEGLEICKDKSTAMGAYIHMMRKNGNAILRKVITYAGAEPSDLLGVDDVQSVMLRLFQAKELCREYRNDPTKFDGLTEATSACASSYGLLEWIIHGKDLI